jgi:cysteine desulfurase
MPVTHDDTIYLDHAATTPVDPEVVRAMEPYLTAQFGNPSSIYRIGQDGRAALDAARRTVAQVFGCQPSEVLFTSGATESDNLALSGVMWQAKLANPEGPSPHLITTAIEHHAVLHTANWLEKIGFAVTYLELDREGFISASSVESGIRPETKLISIMYANNEIGSIQPIAEIGEITRRRGITFHTDAVQAAGALSLKVDDLHVDLLSLSAHKFYGPKGVGILHVRKGTPIAFQQHGGGQESGRRGGTENVAGITGLAVALEMADRNRSALNEHNDRLRNQLWEGLRSELPDIELNGPSNFSQRLPNNLNVSIPGVQGETMLLSLDMQGIAASAGSACTTGNSEPSHVLRAIGFSEEQARASLRFTLGKGNTDEEIEDTIQIMAETVARVRELSASGVT